jgi:transcription antitermination factor NusG
MSPAAALSHRMWNVELPLDLRVCANIDRMEGRSRLEDTAGTAPMVTGVFLAGRLRGSCKEKAGMATVQKPASLYPEDLLETAGNASADCPESGRHWWVLYTKSRQEKACSRQLLGQHVAHYLPLVEKRHIRKGRKFSSCVPLFAGYVFMYGTEQDRIASLTTNRISRILPVHDAAGLCHDLQQIHRLLATGAPVTVEQRFAPGKRVRIRSGAFMGLEGTILARQGTTRLFVAVNFLKQGASIEIEDCLLEPLE